MFGGGDWEITIPFPENEMLFGDTENLSRIESTWFKGKPSRFGILYESKSYTFSRLVFKFKMYVPIE